MATAVLEPSYTLPKAPEVPPAPRWLRVVRRALVALALGLVVASPWWAPRLLSQLAFFHVRRVWIEGARYTRTSELLTLLAVDTLQSVWQDLEPLARRAGSHPLAANVVVERKLPGTLLVRLVEREPVALVQQAGHPLLPMDAAGHQLPIDPARVPLDLPVATSADSVLLHLLGGLKQTAPTLYARVTQAHRAGPDELRLVLESLVVRTAGDVTVTRLKDILPVEADLARNRLRAVELDLRFRDQVIARQP
ncbi:MAG: cell division protein FtsQ/DivIB [Gemmatimonas sp.]|jgi:cell division protein FtsQ|uniref:cell division protein FtsQ/DivIB n=1 Tax=Gemmatimonas sp. TaxID=1962908 RepID=UPI00391FB6FB|nr:FtsQ-type POTRA domain-containing protein [Gemmatimonadota bacterium]